MDNTPNHTQNPTRTHTRDRTDFTFHLQEPGWRVPLGGGAQMRAQRGSADAGDVQILPARAHHTVRL